MKKFISSLCTEIEFLAHHLFVATWQQNQFKTLTKSIPDKYVVSVLDFGKNYICSYQDEPQYMHYGQKQVKVHPIVTYYRCPKDDSTVKEDLVFLSDDIKHDSAAVRTFQKLAYSHLKDQRLLDIQEAVEFTDGCAGQYKSKEPFYDISESRDVLGCPVHRCFFGSRHGKGPGDQVIGVVKSSLNRAVRARQAVISCAEDAFKFCTEKMSKDDNGTCNHKRMTFFLVNKISRETTGHVSLKTVPGTRTVHSVKGVSPGIVRVRNLTCLCSACLSGNTECTGKEKAYVDTWKTVTLEKQKKIKRTGKATESDKKENKNTGKATKSSEKAETISVSKEGLREPSKRNTRAQKSEKSDQLDERFITSVNNEGIREPSKSKRNSKTGIPKSCQQEMKMASQNDKGRRELRKRNSKAGNDKYARQDKPITSLNDKGRRVLRTPSDQQAERTSSLKDERKSKATFKMVNVQSEKNEQVSISRTDYFKNLQCEMTKCRTYDELQVVCVNAEEEVKKFAINVMNPSVVDHAYIIDKSAVPLVPDDVPGDSPKYPVVVYGDGNCLPRSGAVYMPDTDFTEIRVRIVLEGVLFEQRYLDNTVICEGLKERRFKDMVKTYAMYSPEYVPDTILTKTSIQNIYRREFCDVARSGVFMGIWQILCLSSVMGCTVHSVYPMYCGVNVRPDLNRTVYPRVKSSNVEAYILWSSLESEHVELKKRSINHFVPLIPMHTLSCTVDIEDQTHSDLVDQKSKTACQIYTLPAEEDCGFNLSGIVEQYDYDPDVSWSEIVDADSPVKK